MKAYIFFCLFSKIISSTTTFGFDLFHTTSRRRSVSIANNKKVSSAEAVLLEDNDDYDIIRDLQSTNNAGCFNATTISSVDLRVTEISVGLFDSCTEVFVGGETSPCPGTVGTINIQLWYKLIGTGTFVRASSILSEFDTRLSLFTGSTCNALQCIEYNDDANDSSVHSNLEWFAEFGQTYYIRLDDYPCDIYESVPAFGSANAYLILTNPDDDDDTSTPSPNSNTISTPSPNTITAPAPTASPTFSIPSGPIADPFCERAQFIDVGDRSSTLFTRNETSICQTGGLDENLPCPGIGGSIYIASWYIYTGEGTTVRASTDFSDIDTTISVFTGTSCTDLQCIAYNDDNVQTDLNDGADVEFFASFGTTYYIRVEDYPCTFANQISVGSSANVIFTLSSPITTTSPVSSPTTQSPVTSPTTQSPTASPVIFTVPDPPTFAPTARSVVSSPTRSPSSSFVDQNNSPSESPASSSNNGQQDPTNDTPTTANGNRTDPNFANDNRSFSTEEEDKGLNGGVIAGIVVGILVLLFVVIAVGVYFILKKRRSDAGQSNNNNQVPQKVQSQPDDAVDTSHDETDYQHNQTIDNGIDDEPEIAFNTNSASSNGSHNNNSSSNYHNDPEVGGANQSVGSDDVTVETVQNEDGSYSRITTTTTVRSDGSKLVRRKIEHFRR